MVWLGFTEKLTILDNILARRLIGYIAEFNASLQMLFGNGIFRLADMRILGKCGMYFFHGGDEALYVVDEPARHTHGHIEHPQVAVYGYQAAQGYLAPDGHDAAVKHEHNGKYVGKEFKNRHIFGPDCRTVQLRFFVAVIFDFEFSVS